MRLPGFGGLLSLLYLVGRTFTQFFLAFLFLFTAPLYSWVLVGISGHRFTFFSFFCCLEMHVFSVMFNIYLSIIVVIGG